MRNMTTPQAITTPTSSKLPSSTDMAESRRQSTSTLSTLSSGGGTSSDVFIKIALDQLQNAKEAKRYSNLRDAAKNAQAAIERSAGTTNEDLQTMKTVFLPFQLACQSRQPVLVSVAIDCMGKLFTYNYWGKFEDGFSYAENGEHGFDMDGDSPGNRSAATSPTRADRKSSSEARVSSERSDPGILAMVIDTICDSFSGGENTDDKVQVQIVKALLAAASSEGHSAIHGGVLLKAIRTTYNIFLLSKSANTQIVAQATLSQMVQAVFSRVPKYLKPAEPDDSLKPSADGGNDADSESATQIEEQAGQNDLQTSTEATRNEERRSADVNSERGQSPSRYQDDSESAATMRVSMSTASLNSISNDDAAGQALTALSRNGPTRKSEDMLISNFKGSRENPTDMYIKDAYLVFRALCKLTMKPIPAPEGATDLKSHAMRSKLLSLHLVNSILSTHMYVFYSPALVLFSGTGSSSELQFIQAVKQYLCFSLSRNAVSVVPQVFDISMEIFGKVVIGLRTVLKKELSVIITEIIIPILEARSSITFHQRTSLLRCLTRILSDPSADGGRVLVELYLNYDCDVDASVGENIWERLINALSKVTMQFSDPSDARVNPSSPVSSLSGRASNGQPPAITTATLTNFTKEQVKELYSSTGDLTELKKRGLELFVRGVLKPLVLWCQSRGAFATQQRTGIELSPNRAVSEDASKELQDDDESGRRASSTRPLDDPTAFESFKHRKQALVEGIRRFNFKPKKGMQYLLDSGCIPSKSPKDIARFFLTTEGISKTTLGEYLGEGDEENITIMHAVVDEMDFTGMKFLEAIREFIQHFRLPGESQKIDRFMLKFAERYMKGNPQAFASADTPYIVAYSVIMLNTDQHNSQVKKRMTKEDFLKNNRGIDDGKDLDPAFLGEIYDDISANEIVMFDEASKAGAAGTPDVSADARYRNRREVAQFAITSENMALKTENMFNTLLKGGQRPGTVRRVVSAQGSPAVSTGHTREGSLVDGNGSNTAVSGAWYSATHYEHVRGMIQTVWMAILTGLSGPLQDTEDMEVISLGLEGFKLATRIICLFDNCELERKAFLSTLFKLTQLTGNLQEIKTKNIEAVKTLLEIAHLEGNSLGDSWKDVVLCVSQLEKLQLVGGGNEDSRTVRQSTDRNNQRRESHQATRTGRYLDEAAAEASSQSMTIAVDRIFTSSVKLSGAAIVEFVRALSEVSWDEIVSSSDKEHPRMYCLQRIVEISYYNMKRIRMEWSHIWAILGEHFNKVGSHPNANVGFFALDKLRQLAMKFLDMEELPSFKFQKDFLRPFEHILGNNPDPKIKDMVLVCLQQMIQAKVKTLKSGWKTMFGAFQRAAKEQHEPVVLLAFDIIKNIYKNHFESVVANGTFPDFIACIVEFCKNRKFPKISLHSVELLRQSIGRVGDMAKAQGDRIAALKLEQSHVELPKLESPSHQPTHITTQPGVIPIQRAAEDDPNYKFWIPILFGLYQIIMTCDLEVRTRGLTYLFDTLKTYGSGFTRDFWEVLSKGVLFPIFDDLNLSRQEHTKFANREDMSVWLSTTLIQALRQLIDLFGVYFDTLSFLVDGMLELLTVCMTQENETLARIGSTCLQQFIETNVSKLNEELWEKICNMFVHLFEVTTPYGLFFDTSTPLNGVTVEDSEALNYQQPQASNSESQYPIGPAGMPLRPRPQKKEFQQIIVKCVLHLLIIQTVNEILTSNSNPQIPDQVYRSLKSDHLFVLIDSLEKSYRFAQRFNGDLELRMQLFKMGFMKQLPNLLKQETSSVSCYISVLIKMHSDPSPERQAMREETEKRLLPLCYDILQTYNTLDPEKRRNVNAWRPVVVTILNALVDFDEPSFRATMPKFYGEVVNLLLQDVTSDIRLVLHSLLMRTGVAIGLISNLARDSIAGSVTDLRESFIRAGSSIAVASGAAAAGLAEDGHPLGEATHKSEPLPELSESSPPLGEFETSPPLVDDNSDADVL
ncbi:hypothetical protein BJ742DRAFT_552239 [Cladochytrium replicatum]|nr:hypothetical protein BJ742DRAFT_552239 [Cladochytrium replicatum]